MITFNNSGVPLYHYSKRLIRENERVSLLNKNAPMSRRARRKLKRKLKNKGVVIDKENNCLYIDL